MRRHAIGIIALCLLLGALVLWIWPQGTADAALLGAIVRVGAVMAALWLAYPDVERLPAWTLPAFPVLLLLIAVRPKWFFLLLPILILLAVLRPRKG